jgi:hypothetical protein
MHHTSMFCVCHPPTLFLMHFSLAYFSFLFLCAPTLLCYLFGGQLVSCYFLLLLQDHLFLTDLATSFVKNWRN